MHRYLRVALSILVTIIFSAILFTASSSAQNYLHTLVGITRRVSVNTDGTQGDNNSVGNVISADGRYVAFISSASNLVPDDTNNYCDNDYDGTLDNCPDVFVRDMLTGETTRVSVASDGTQGNYYSGDWSQGLKPSISADGRYVAFTSWASNLVEPDTNGGLADVYLHDRVTGETIIVSVDSNGFIAAGPDSRSALSSDGRYVAFQTGDQMVGWDDNAMADVYVHDRQTGGTTIVSVSSDGEVGNNTSGFDISISGDGRYVAFVSIASNLVGEPYIYYDTSYLHDLQTGETTLVDLASDGSRGNGRAYWPTLSSDGRYLAFVSDSSNLVANDTNGVDDVFIRDLQTGEVVLASVTSSGQQVSGGYYGASISPDGNFVAFSSTAEDLVPGDTNGNIDIFLRDLLSGGTSLVSIANDGT